MEKILIMGLPGSGKTYFAERLKRYIEENSTVEHMNPATMANFETLPRYWRARVDWFNADEVRKKYNDWDFSKEGRIRQSLRMAKFALECGGDYAICDFVAPLPEMRANFAADWTIWMDTIEAGRFEDTNKVFESPTQYDFRITEQRAEVWVPWVGKRILERQRRPVFQWDRETVQMLGRWQPWHPGHRALFERALAKTGQVCIMIRDCHGWRGSNPFQLGDVENRIRRDLDPLYQGQYEIVVVPNIVNITYGRDVGYTIEQEVFDDATHAISATKIRQEMGLQ